MVTEWAASVRRNRGGGIANLTDFETDLSLIIGCSKLDGRRSPGAKSETPMFDSNRVTGVSPPTSASLSYEAALPHRTIFY